MHKYTYYHQNRTKENSLRRYTLGSEKGERWCSQDGVWVKQCADLLSCLITKDTVITKEEAESLFPGSTKNE